MGGVFGGGGGAGGGVEENEVRLHLVQGVVEGRLI